MTGYGRGTVRCSDNQRSITVEVKAVNHRYCDITVKMPEVAPCRRENKVGSKGSHEAWKMKRRP